MKANRSATTFGICGVFILLACLSLVAFIKIPSVLRRLALSQSGITEGSLAADLFAAMPFDIHQNIYVFNITNREDFFNGGKPHFEQLGPYVFKVGFRKRMSWSDGDLLTYRENRKFWFDAALSNGHLNDTVYTVDPVYAAAQEAIDDLPEFLKKLVIPLLRSRKVLFERTVGELLDDGYTDALADLAHLIKPKLPVINGKIGYMRAFNDTDDGDITVFAGSNASTLSKRNIVIRWRNNDSIPFFSGECSRLWGTNAQVFPPSSLSSPLPEIGVFLPMFCRPWPLHFNGTRWENGLNLVTYGTGLDMFSPSNNSEIQECGQPGVWPRGVFDIQACQNSFPGMLSLPHFLHADENILNDVEGLEPNVTKHDFHLELFPMLGVPVKGAMRVQLNVRIFRYLDSTRSANPPVVYPILWQEIVLTESAVFNISNVIWFAIRLPQIILQIIPLTLLVLSLGIVFAYALCRKDLTDDSQSMLDDAEDIATNAPAPPLPCV